MAPALHLLLLLAAGSGVASAATPPHAAAYSGAAGGRFYGGSYPGAEPPLFGRFGEPPAFLGGFPTYAPQFPFGPGAAPFLSPFDFNQFFQNYFQALNDNLAVVFSENNAHQRAAFDAAQKALEATAPGRLGPGSRAGWPGNRYGAGRYGAGAGAGASASASLGPGGGWKSAHLSPEPLAPSISSRFDGDAARGSYGVSSSAFSSSSDVGGKRTGHRQASTTVNDNGKVTTYTVRD